MIDTIINGALLIAFTMACVEYIIQTVRVYKQKSAKDISLWSTSLRLLGMLIILAKTIRLGDPMLFWGQFILIAIFLVSFGFIVWYHKPRS